MKITRREFLKRSAVIGGLALVGDSLFNISRVFAEESTAKIPFAPKEDVLIPSTCVMCVNFCGIRVRRVDGVIRAIYGNPDNPYNAGHLCPKGQSGVFDTYNPYRVKVPLKRTNPNKDPRVDPGWMEISWEEALNEVAGKLKEVREKDPRGLTFFWGHGKYLIQDKYLKAFNSAFGTPNGVHRTTVCEAARHVADELTWGGHGFLPDLENTEYYINMGANFTEGGQWARWLDRTAMKRVVDDGMKMVVIEPRLSNLGAKASEWIPIKPGADVVFLLGMAKQLINDGYLDTEFLTRYTDACYLVGPDYKFLRDKEGHQLVWDKTKGDAVPYDEAEEIALDTRVMINGTEYKTAFFVFKEYLMSLSPGEIEDITGIPYNTIVKISREFGKHARIGATVEVNGQKLRYRPVAIHTFRGMSAKEYGSQNWRAALIVQMLVGNFDAVGGLLLHKANPNYKNMKPSKCEFPPTHTDLSQSVFYPHATHNVAQQPALTFSNPEKYNLPYKPEMALIYATNRLISTAEVEKQIEGFRKVYSANINIVLDESAQMSDIVLPDLAYLESWHFSPTRWTPDSSHAAIRQPIVNAYNIPYGAFDTLWELAKRAGFLNEYVDAINKSWKLKKMKFEKGRDYNSRESVRIIWEESTGLPLEYAIKNGFVAKKVDVKKRYLSNLPKFDGKGKPKIHFYAEQLIHTREKVIQIMKENQGVMKVFQEWYEEQNPARLEELLAIKFSPVPLKEHAFPTPHRTVDRGRFPLYLITYKRIYRNQASADCTNPVLNEVAHDSRYNFVLINTGMADQLGIRDGNEVWVESRVGKIKAIAKLTEGIRPDTVAISYHYGRFSSGLPDYAKEGAMPNFIIEYHPDVVSGHSSFNDTMVNIARL